MEMNIDSHEWKKIHVAPTPPSVVNELEEEDLAMKYKNDTSTESPKLFPKIFYLKGLAHETHRFCNLLQTKIFW